MSWQDRGVRGLEALGIAAFVAMVGEAAWRLASAGTGLCLGLLALPLAYYLADLLSGVIHWICDSFGSAATPVWGPMLVGPFRRHHRAPLDITQISLLENLGASAIAGALVLWLWSPVTAQGWAQSWGQGLRWLGLELLVFAVLSNLFHRWAHLPRAQRPAWLRRAQAWHLLLDSDAHLRHHRPPHRLNYCILSGWANPLSNRIPWPRIEAALARVGIKTCFD
jgi:plasmanylethanolamine desaturase